MEQIKIDLPIQQKYQADQCIKYPTYVSNFYQHNNEDLIFSRILEAPLSFFPKFDKSGYKQTSEDEPNVFDFKPYHNMPSGERLPQIIIDEEKIMNP